MSQEPYASAKRVFWIVDTGSSHRGDAAAQRLTEASPTTVMVHTPIHASWLNQVEIYYSIVQRKGLSPNDFTDLTEVETRLASFEQRFNATAAPFNWKFAADDLDDLLTRIDRHERAHQPDTAPIKHAAWLPTNFRSRPPTYSGPANPPGQFRTATTPPARPARRTRRREPGRSGAVGVDRADPSAPVRGLMALARRRSDAILPVSVPQGRQGVWARFSAGKAECLGSLLRREGRVPGLASAAHRGPQGACPQPRGEGDVSPLVKRRGQPLLTPLPLMLRTGQCRVPLPIQRDQDLAPWNVAAVELLLSAVLDPALVVEPEPAVVIPVVLVPAPALHLPLVVARPVRNIGRIVCLGFCRFCRRVGVCVIWLRLRRVGP